MIKKLIIFISLFLLLISAAGVVSAQKNDFYASAPNINLCSCALVVDSITFVNNGVITNSFVLQQSGSAAGFATLEKISFVLESGESTTVKEYFRAPCDAKGNFDLVTEIWTDTGLRKTLTQKVLIGECDNINISVADAEKKPCLCEPFRYDFTITNPSGFDDTYSFYPSKHDEYASISQKRVIKAGNSENFVLVFDLPCDVKGNKKFDLVVETQKTGLIKKIPLGFEINESCYANPLNLTAKPVKPGIDATKLFNYSFIALAILPIILIILILLAALRFVPERRRAVRKIEVPSYEWEKVFKRKKPANVFLACVILLLIIAVLVSSSVFFVMNPPTRTVNETVTNATINETISPEINITGMNLTTITAEFAKTGFLEVFRTLRQKNFSIFKKPGIGFGKPEISVPKLNITTPRLNLTMPKFDFSFLKKEPIERSPVFEKETALNFLYSVRAFVITYLYYIVAGFVALAVILYVLSKQEKKIKKGKHSEAKRKG